MVWQRYYNCKIRKSGQGVLTAFLLTFSLGLDIINRGINTNLSVFQIEPAAMYFSRDLSEKLELCDLLCRNCNPVVRSCYDRVRQFCENATLRRLTYTER